MELKKINLIIALQIAIEERSKHERKVLKYTGDSTLVAGWKQILTALQADINVKIVD